MPNDVIAQLPLELAQYKKQHGKLPEGAELEPNYFCTWNNRYFVHTRATLPLKDFNGGVGFGLWVEISKNDFDTYLAAEDDETAYKNFKAEGTLANEWPGFEHILGVKVTVRTVFADEKIYITDVHIDGMRDPLFHVALLAQSGDSEKKAMIQELVSAYVADNVPG